MKMLVPGSLFVAMRNHKATLLSHVSHVQLCVTPQTAAHQAPPSLGFSRQEHQLSYFKFYFKAHGGLG